MYELICLRTLVKAALTVNLITARSFHGLGGVIAARSRVPGPFMEEGGCPPHL